MDLNLRKVLITEPIHSIGWTLLRKETEPVAWEGAEVTPLNLAVKDVHAIIVRAVQIPGEVIRAAPRLRVIAKHGVGYDNIDIKTATEMGIIVISTPEANTESVAEHALALMLAVSRKVALADRHLREGILRHKEEYTGTELHGKVLGVVGLGRIGRRLAGLCKAAFQMQVLGYDPYLSEWSEWEGIGWAENLHGLLGVADFVSLHVPLTGETTHRMGREELRRMKPTAILINTSRGKVVDEMALYEALSNGWIAGAGLDVLAEEPPNPDHPLLKLDSVVITPHIAGTTEESMRRMAETVAHEVLRVLRGERPLYPVNPEVL